MLSGVRLRGRSGSVVVRAGDRGVVEAMGWDQQVHQQVLHVLVPYLVHGLGPTGGGGGTVKQFLGSCGHNSITPSNRLKLGDNIHQPLRAA